MRGGRCLSSMLRVSPPPGGLLPEISKRLGRARKTLRNLDWFEVTELRGHLTDEGPSTATR